VCETTTGRLKRENKDSRRRISPEKKDQELQKLEMPLLLKLVPQLRWLWAIMAISFTAITLDISVSIPNHKLYNQA
jgi:hypothetical protein